MYPKEFNTALIRSVFLTSLTSIGFTALVPFCISVWPLFQNNLIFEKRTKKCIYLQFHKLAIA